MDYVPLHSVPVAAAVISSLQRTIVATSACPMAGLLSSARGAGQWCLANSHSPSDADAHLPAINPAGLEAHRRRIRSRPVGGLPSHISPMYGGSFQGSAGATAGTYRTGRTAELLSKGGKLRSALHGASGETHLIERVLRDWPLWPSSGGVSRQPQGCGSGEVRVPLPKCHPVLGF